MPHTEVVGVSDSVTYTAVLPVDEDTVQFVSGLLAAERRRRGTRSRRRALAGVKATCYADVTCGTRRNPEPRYRRMPGTVAGSTVV